MTTESSIGVSALVAEIKLQREAALDMAAQRAAEAAVLQAEIARLQAEIDKLKGATDGA